MSLESYRKALEAQKEREGVFEPNTGRDMPQRPEYAYAGAKPRKKRSGCLIFFILIAALLIVSAVKNPSERESKEMVKSYIVDNLNNYLRDEVANEDSSGAKQFGALLGMAFGSNLVEYLCEIKVNDYVVFTTFDCTTKVYATNKTIVSGIIYFGKIIPLESEIKKR